MYRSLKESNSGMGGAGLKIPKMCSILCVNALMLMLSQGILETLSTTCLRFHVCPNFVTI